MTWWRPAGRPGAVLLLLLLGIASVGTARPEEHPSASSATSDCGTQALYVLLRLEGRSVEPARLGAILPPPRPDGHSMKELRDAARVVRLDLAGVRIRRSDRAPDRPILALVHDGPHGHFIVVRPIGHTGRLVQVIDGIRPPRVVNAAVLYASPGWTGLALIPHRPIGLARIIGLLGAGSGLALLFATLRRLRRQRRAAPAGVM